MWCLTHLSHATREMRNCGSDIDFWQLLKAAAKDAATPKYAYIPPVKTPNSTSEVPSAGYVNAEITAGIVGGIPQPSGIGPA